MWKENQLKQRGYTIYKQVDLNFNLLLEKKKS